MRVRIGRIADRFDAAARGEQLVHPGLAVRGGALTILLLVSAAVARGEEHDLDVRRAGPGEFTARAFMNGRISLAAAEGVAATIAARSDGHLDAARHLGGNAS